MQQRKSEVLSLLHCFFCFQKILFQLVNFIESWQCKCRILLASHYIYTFIDMNIDAKRSEKFAQPSSLGILMA